MECVARSCYFKTQIAGHSYKILQFQGSKFNIKIIKIILTRPNDDQGLIYIKFISIYSEDDKMALCTADKMFR